ncbi:helix-turn-helix transcriptional regulator [Streptomyces sp. NPDC097941]|uniref:helix-turn-helix domain-containing protein n=1 Tax=Streptomyces sp. NPDC097941 TaxID=3155685 RepID=UPI00332B361E
MARPENHLHRDGTPRRELALALRDLRGASGLTYAQMASRCNYSISALQEAASGQRLATLPATLAFVTACGGDTNAWQHYWNQLRRMETEGTSVAAGALTPLQHAQPQHMLPVPGPAPSNTAPKPEPTTHAIPQPSAPHRFRHLARLARHRHLRWMAPTALLAAVGGGLTALLSPHSSAPHHSAPAFALVVVQNKVAIGPSTLTEDSTPVYLSTKTVSRCRIRHCMLADTSMVSGAKLVATCWTRGETLTNADMTSTGINRNPDAVSSDRWYLAKWKDGRTGYICEVYIAPAYRGGVGLNHCR